jgi:hypothetical protein
VGCGHGTVGSGQQRVVSGLYPVGSGPRAGDNKEWPVGSKHWGRQWTVGSDQWSTKKWMVNNGQ